MRHRKKTFKIGRTGSHRRAMISNMLQALIMHGRIETTLRKAKELKIHADKLITLAKGNSLAAKRTAVSKLHIRYNHLAAKESRKAKEKPDLYFNTDRKVIKILFGELKDRFANRNGGYTRIIKEQHRRGDSAPLCYLEYIKE